MNPASGGIAASSGVGLRMQRSAMVLGAGLAGTALTRALARRGWSITLLDDADPQAGSRQAALAVHPAHAPDLSPASRLTRIGVRLIEQDAHGAQGLEAGWIAHGRLQKMAPDRARKLVKAWPDGPLSVVTALQAKQLTGMDVGDMNDHGMNVRGTNVRGTNVHGMNVHGTNVRDTDVVDAGLGVWWSIPSVVDPQTLLTRWFRQSAAAAADHGARLHRVQARVHQLSRDPQGHWVMLGEQGQVLARAPVAVICAGARSADLPLEVAPAPSKEALQAASQAAAVWASAGWHLLQGQCARSRQAVPQLRSVVGEQGVGHVLPLVDGHLLRGPLADPGRGDLLTGLETVAAGFEPLGPGLRASVRDHLPLVGAWPDLVTLGQQWSALARNARLPLPRLPGLWSLSGLGGRGVLWSLPTAEHLASRINDDASLLDERLSDAIDPTRFLRRALRGGVPDLTQALGLA